MNDPFSKLSWDDFRIVRAVVHSGGPIAAARMLGINGSTITRRLARLEELLSVALFDRRRTGYVATVQGEEIAALAERVELDVAGVARRVSGHGQGHAGDLRITTSDSILLYFLTPLIASFRVCNPAVRVEVSVGNDTLNLARGESDIAIRATEVPPENLFGRKVAVIAWAPYAASGGAASSPRTACPLAERQWVSYSGRLSGLKAAGMVAACAAAGTIAYSTDSVAGAAAAIAAGLGVGYLPCMLGDLSPDLERVGPVEPALDDDLWLLTHPDIRRSGRIYAFMNHCAEAIGRQRDLVEGRFGPPSGRGGAVDRSWRPLSFPAAPR